MLILYLHCFVALVVVVVVDSDYVYVATVKSSRVHAMMLMLFDNKESMKDEIFSLQEGKFKLQECCMRKECMKIWILWEAFLIFHGYE